MALFHRIAAAANVQIVLEGGRAYIAAGDIESFLESARRLRVGIVRIQAHRRIGERIVPDEATVAHFESLRADPDFAHRSIRETRGFLAVAGRADHLYALQILGRNPLGSA